MSGARPSDGSSRSSRREDGEEREDVVDVAFAFTATHAPRRRAQAQVVDDREAREDSPALRHVRDPQCDDIFGRPAGDRPPVESDVADGRSE